MPRSKKTAVSRETSSASTLRESAGTKLKSEPPPDYNVTLKSGVIVNRDEAIRWRDLGTVIIELGYYFPENVVFDALAARVEELEKRIGVVIEPSSGYSMEQWVEDYKKWRDRVIGLALDDAIAALKPEEK
jgi:uncharacterized protein (DUF1697 family)